MQPLALCGPATVLQHCLREVVAACTHIRLRRDGRCWCALVLSLLQLFTPEELAALERESDGVDARARDGCLPETCYHHTSAWVLAVTLCCCCCLACARCLPACLPPLPAPLPACAPTPLLRVRAVAKGGGLKRTKLFFGARYMWTRDQLAQQDSRVAGGVRVDVPPVRGR